MIDVPVPVVLASSSPARRELLGRLVSGFCCEDPAVPEDLQSDEQPAEGAVRLALAKARQVAARRPGCLVIGADTLVVCRGRVMGKPKDREDAERMLSLLTANEHTVITGVAVVAPDGRRATACVPTVVRMRAMSEEDIRRHCARPAVLRWAGAYALQEDDSNVRELSGSATGVIGLPLEALRRLLCDFYPCAEERCGTA